MGEKKNKAYIYTDMYWVTHQEQKDATLSEIKIRNLQKAELKDTPENQSKKNKIKMMQQDSPFCQSYIAATQTKWYSVGCMALHVLSPDLRCNLPMLDGWKRRPRGFSC